MSNREQILSIDAQRLELADVLASGSPTDASRTVAEKVNAPPDAEPPRATGWRVVLRARTARVGSFIFVSFRSGDGSASR